MDRESMNFVLKKHNGLETEISVNEKRIIKKNKYKMEIGLVEEVNVFVADTGKEISLIKKQSLYGKNENYDYSSVLSDEDQQKMHQFLKDIGIRTLSTFRIAKDGIYMTNLNKGDDIALSYNNDSFINGDKNRSSEIELANKYSINNFDELIFDLEKQLAIASDNNLLIGSDAILYVFKDGLKKDKVDIIPYVADLDSDVSISLNLDVNIENIKSLKHALSVMVSKYVKPEFKDEYLGKIDKLK